MADQPSNEPAVDPAAGAVPPTPEEALTDEALADMPPPAADADPSEVPSAEDALTAESALSPDDGPDYQDLYLRARAEMDNLRKRSRRDVAAAAERGVAKLTRELLPAIDNLDRALAAAETQEGVDSDHHLTKGIRLVQAELVGALQKVGVTLEDPKGQPFDPHRHEALAQQPVPGTEPGMVVETYQPGYLLGETVVRAARVVVSG